MVGKSAVILGLAGILVACPQKKSSSNPEGHLEVSWSGKDKGAVSGRATARWCGLRKVLEIQTVRGDTGIALAVYPGRALAPGNFVVTDPAKAESLPPAAALAVRWLGPTVVQGFRGDSGRVVLERSATRLFSGRVDARARSVVDTQRIHLSGTFRDLAIRPDSSGCTADTDADSAESDAARADTGVH